MEPPVTDRELAQALLASETSLDCPENGSSSSDVPNVAMIVANGEVVLQRLQKHLLGWFGPDGVDALLVRALERTRPYNPVLAGVQRASPGVLHLSVILDSTGYDAASNRTVTGEEVTEALVALLAAILGLISRLVGDDMMRQLIGQMWPDLFRDALPLDASPTNNERSGK